MRIIYALLIIVCISIVKPASSQCNFKASISMSEDTVCAGTVIYLLETIRYYKPNSDSLDDRNYWNERARYLNNIETFEVDWNWGDSLNQWVRSIGQSHIYSEAGSYVITMVSKDSTNCYDTVTTEVYVSDVDVDFSVRDSIESCQRNIALTETITVSDPCTPNSCDSLKTWYWLMDGDTLNEVTNPQFSFKLGKTHISWLHAETYGGCRDSILRTLKARAPNLKFNYFGAAVGATGSACLGSGQYIANLTDKRDANHVYKIDWGNNKQTLINGYWSYTKSPPYDSLGIYRISMTLETEIQGTNVRCLLEYPDSSSPVLIKVWPLPPADFKISTNPTYVNHPTALTPILDSIYTRVIWNYGDGESEILDVADGKQIYKYPETGSYEITLIPFHDNQNIPRCSDTIRKTILVLPDSLNSINTIGAGINIYPNPTSEKITLSGEGLQDINSLHILDVNGKLINKIQIRNAGELIIDIEGPPGVYFVEAKTKHGYVFRRKVIKQ